MKSLDKVIKLTNNPLTLFFGLNHKYLERTFTFFFRCGVAIIVIAMIYFLDDIKALILIPIVLGYYFIVDKLRIKGHLNKYNRKFEEGLNFLREKKYYKSLKKFISLGGLKTPIFWIVENEPQILLGSLSDKVDIDAVKKLTKQIENKDVEGVVSSFQMIALKY